MTDVDLTNRGWEEWRRQRRRVTVWWPLVGLGITVACLLPVLIIDLTGVTASGSGRGSSGSFLRVWSTGSTVILVVLLAVTILSLRTALRDRVLSRVVIDNDGRVCPRCRIAMTGQREESDSGDVDGDEPESVLSCRRCGVTLDAPAVRRYWEQTVYSPLWAKQWKSKTGLAGTERGLGARAVALRTRHPNVAKAIAALVGMAIVIVIAVSMGGGPAGIVLRSTIGLMMIGVFLFMARSRAPRSEPDDDPRCAKCGYARPTEAERLPLCPECGSDWNHVGGTLLGAEPKTREFLAVGVAMVVISALIMGGSVGFSAIAARVLPPRMLIPLIDGSFLTSDRVVEAVAAAELDEATRRRLAERLIDLHDRERLLPPSVESLLERLFVDGDLAQFEVDGGDGETLAEIYLRQLVAARIEGADVATVGEPVRLQLMCEPRMSPLTGIETRIAWSGWHTDGGHVFGRSETIQPAMSLWRTAARRPDGIPAAINFTPARPGRARITGDLWIIGDAAIVPIRGVTWNDLDEPTLEDPPPIAMTRITLSAEIDVREP